MINKLCDIFDVSSDYLLGKSEFEKIETLKITLKKPQAPIKADFNYVAVEIERSRKWLHI